MRFSFCAAAALLLISAPAFAFGLNDLSVLLPLPSSAQDYAALLSPSSPAQGGPLVPSTLIQKLPRLILAGPDGANHQEPPEATKAALRVVALRFDPCFQEAGEPCRHQIRLIFQPVEKMDGGYEVEDAAVHAFYEFGDAEWQRIVQEWRAIAVGAPADSLDVHPQIKREGLTGAQWTRIKTLVLAHCSPALLTRLTESTVNFFGSQWTFLFFHIGPGPALVPASVPRVNNVGQTFFDDIGSFREFFGGVGPELPKEDSRLSALWKDSLAERQRTPEPELQKAAIRAISFENPRKFSPGNLDCVSCHLASPTKDWAQRTFAGWPWAKMFEEAAFKSGWNLKNNTKTAGLTNQVRAFGYFFDLPVISQRVVNETAAVAELMSKGERSLRAPMNAPDL